MTLSELIKNIKPVSITGDPTMEITGVDIDSRQVAQGHLFIAMKGTQTDGHKYIGTAVAQGAAAILCETLPEEPNTAVTYVVVSSTEQSAGPVATTFYGDPSRRLKLVGVTGTNGNDHQAVTLYYR